MQALNVALVNSTRKNRKLRVVVDRPLQRPRNLVERCLNKLKNAPGVATC
jgi:hypothetical protein